MTKTIPKQPGDTMTYGLNLPEYPWEALAPYRATAAAHPDGPVDLSIRHPG